MSRIVLSTAVGVVISGCVALSAPPAQAAPDHGVKRGTIVVCADHVSHVYADGPSLRETDLADFTKSGECSDWAPVLPGPYNVGFGWRTPPPYNVTIQVRIQRGHHKFYKVFNREGVVSTWVAPGEKTFVLMFFSRG